MPDFVHLHCHTEYSLLDGAIRIEDLCQKAKDLGMPAVAITDHGNLYGALNFYLTAKKYGLKPIIGSEVYVCHDHTDKTSELARVRYHLVLLAQNFQGYHNLVKIVSQGALHGFYGRPRVDKNILRTYSDGIIALSACIGGEVPKVALTKGFDAALEVAKEYAEIFPDRFFLELQKNELKLQEPANKMLLEISRQTGLPIVATNDCHYLNKEDYEAHDVLLCIQTQAVVHEEKRMRFDAKDLYYKSPEEMEKDFTEYPEALANTGRIALEMCEDYNFNLKDYHFPNYELPEGTTIDEEFRRMAWEGLEKRFANSLYPMDREIYTARMEEELEVICSMKFPGYFLIVQDFINWGKNNGVPVGPGRGSAAGSLVAYALRITNLDPIPYNLLFERFLNKERISMPDIDVDFCEAKRHLVIEYVGRKYGSDSVAQITTFGKMMAKGVVRDVGRALGHSVADCNRVAKLIPTDLKMTIKKALVQEPELDALYKSDPTIKKWLDTAMRLEGLSRHASIHAAGLVISDKPMSDYLPLYRGKQENDVVTQYDMKMVEKVGLVKFDFLGLRNMTVIAETLENIRKQGKEVPDLDYLPLDDGDTYKLYSSGNTDGIFQVESQGMRQYLRMLRPTVFEDIIAMLALYRPGPLKSGMVEEFIKRKHGQVAVDYPLPSLETCLKDTYGVIVYQEQVMQIAQIVAGYTLGGADLLRRAMGKKDPEAMAKERSKFIEGALLNKIEEKKAAGIFDLMEKFAEYGFNKSHSAAYALISYHTAYLKAHYGVEFMAALLSSEMTDKDKLLKYVAACKDMDITVISPSVRQSHWRFTVQDNAIIFGLGGIKNVGEEAVKDMVREREENGDFTSFYDFCSRVSSRKMTKRALESLIKAGACDCFGVTRAGLFAALDLVVAKAQKRAKEKNSNQVSLFAFVPEDTNKPVNGIGFECPEQDAEEWNSELISRYEKDALGFFLHNHPLLPYRNEVKRLQLLPLEEYREMPPNSLVKAAVLVNSVRVLYDRKNRKWGLVQIEDLTASGTAFCFHELYEQAATLLDGDVPLYIEGRISKDRDSDNGFDEEGGPREVKLVLEKVTLLSEVCANCTEPVMIKIPVADEGDLSGKLLELEGILAKYAGDVPVQAIVRMPKSWCVLELGAKYGVKPGPLLNRDIEAWSKS